MCTRVCALAHTIRLQRYKKKLTYTIVYAIFMHFYVAKAILSVHLGSYIREHAYDLSQIIRVCEIAKTGIFLVEGCDSLHVSIGKREIEYIEVLRHSLFVG